MDIVANVIVQSQWTSAVHAQLNGYQIINGHTIPFKKGLICVGISRKDIRKSMLCFYVYWYRQRERYSYDFVLNSIWNWMFCYIVLFVPYYFCYISGKNTFSRSVNNYIIGFLIFRLWAYLMMVISDMSRAH